eukprot:9028922-Lingulodinium_polyedra.AAC.1
MLPAQQGLIMVLALPEDYTGGIHSMANVAGRATTCLRMRVCTCSLSPAGGGFGWPPGLMTSAQTLVCGS